MVTYQYVRRHNKVNIKSNASHKDIKFEFTNQACVGGNIISFLDTNVFQYFVDHKCSSDTWIFNFNMAAIIINDVMARALYPAIIFICYYLFSIPMGCLRKVFKLLLDSRPIRDQKFFNLLKIERQITTWPQDRKCNYFNFSCLYSDVYNYCYPCCRFSNIPSPFRQDSWLWCFRDGHWCRKGY